MKVLVLDDSPSIREIIRSTLDKRMGFTVTEAEDVVEALAHVLADSSFDLVITDLLMPGLGGEALIRHLRASERTAGIPILVVSGEARAGRSAEKALEAGATAFLAKPFTIPQLVEKVRSLLPP